MLSHTSIPLLLMCRVFVAAAAHAGAMQDAGAAASGAALALRDKPLDATQLKRDDCEDVYSFAIGSNDNIAAVHDNTNELALVSSDCTRELWRVKVC